MVKAIDYSKNCKLYTTDCFCGADKRYRIKVRFITEFIWHSIFVRNMFLRSTRKEFEKVKTDFTVLNVSNLIADEHENMEIKELGMQVPDDTYNLDQARLIEEAIINKECQLGPEGVLLATTGKYSR